MKKKEKHKEIIAGVDIGTKAIKLIVAEKKGNDIYVLDLRKTPSKGIKKGKVTDPSSVVETIRNVLDEAERNIGFPIESAYVIYGGSSIKVHDKEAETTLEGKRKIVFSDIKETVNLVLEEFGDASSIIHIFSVNYAVDDEWGVENPVGKEGSLLRSQLLVVEGDKEEMAQASSCAEKAGLKIKGLLNKAAISPLGCFSSKPSEIVLYLDIGAGTTTASLFKGSKILSLGAYPIGGNHITSDLSYLLGIPPEKSEALKKIVSMTEPEENLEDELEFDLDGERAVCRVGDVLEIIKTRIEELFVDLILKDLKTKVSMDFLSLSRIVLSGGVSKMKGFKTFVKDICGVPVEIGVPSSNFMENWREPENASLAGLINYVVAQETRPYAILDNLLGGSSLTFGEEDTVFSSQVAEKVRKAKQKRLKGHQIKKVIDTFKKTIKELF